MHLSRAEIVKIAESAEPLEEIEFDEDVDIDRFFATVARSVLEMKDKKITKED